MRGPRRWGGTEVAGALLSCERGRHKTPTERWTGNAPTASTKLRTRSVEGARPISPKHFAQHHVDFVLTLAYGPLPRCTWGGTDSSGGVWSRASRGRASRETGLTDVVLREAGAMVIQRQTLISGVCRDSWSKSQSWARQWVASTGALFSRSSIFATPSLRRAAADRTTARADRACDGECLAFGTDRPAGVV